MTAIERTVRARLCARDGCPVRYDSFGKSCPWPAKYCSPRCHLLATAKPAERPARAQLVTRTPTKRKRAVSPASPAQRAVAASGGCIVCGAGGCEPAHLIDRSLWPDPDDDPRRIVRLCPRDHRLYDDGLDILADVELHARPALAFAVEGFGLLPTLRRVTNTRWAPTGAAQTC